MPGDGRPNRWPKTSDGRYKCTECERTYARHSGVWRHYNLHHISSTKRESNICSKRGCNSDVFGEFHLCETHLLEHEENARNFINRVYEVNEDGCWIFNGPTSQSGYPLGHSYNLHQRGSEVVVGIYKLSLYLHNRLNPNHDLHTTPFVQYGDVHHKCKVRKCLNPEHLIEMSENMHQVMHNLHINRIAISVLDEFSEHYPHLKPIFDDAKIKL